MKGNAMRRLPVFVLAGFCAATCQAAEQTPTLPWPGKAPAPVQRMPAQTPSLQRLFEPRMVATQPISMTGVRPEPVSITTNEISMTGQRFSPVVVDTGELSMTGQR
jgi:hypothetical protein